MINILPYINRRRLVEEFCELVAIDSVSFHERQMADVLKGKLNMLGIEAAEDNAAEVYHSEAGNLYGCLQGTLQGPPLLFSAHMDTVEPGAGKRAVLQEDGRITSTGDTVLGSDDLAGAAAILEALRVLKERQIPHRSVEILFPIAEEAYTRGSSVFDYSGLRAKEAYVLDLSGPVGGASLQEPTLISFVIQVRGKASHAGFAPEEGIHAIAVASKAIAGLRQGKTDSDTTVNIGKIEGGKATNIVPDLVTVEGEIRSYDHEKAKDQFRQVQAAFEEAAREVGAEIQVRHDIYLTAYRVDASEPVVRRFERVCAGLDIPCELTKTFGGSDNNSFLRNGIRGIVLACGMNQVHTCLEYTTEEELARCTAVVAGLLTEK